MIKFVVVCLLCIQAYARPNFEDLGIESHIVGGVPAAEGQFPFIVSLRDKTGFTFCGGALISNKHVITAAHCVATDDPIKIGAGSVNLSQQKIFNVEQIIRHPNYDMRMTYNDIALLKLAEPVPIGGNIQTIAFPVKENLDKKNVTALGWGRISAQGPASPKLLYLNRPILSNKECATKLIYKIQEGQICLDCVENFGMCFGDSGSPLYYKGADGKAYVAGIVSWGIPCAKGYPDVFTRVSHYEDWIKQNMS